MSVADGNHGCPAPREGDKIFGSAVLQPARSVCVSASAFFISSLFWAVFRTRQLSEVSESETESDHRQEDNSAQYDDVHWLTRAGRLRLFD